MNKRKFLVALGSMFAVPFLPKRTVEFKPVTYCKYITITGDVYGFDDFEREVLKAFRYQAQLDTGNFETLDHNHLEM